MADHSKYDTYGLLIAAHNGRLENVQRHLDNGVDVNGRSCLGGWTALHKASKAGHLEVVKLLLSNGADVNIMDEYGDKPAAFSATNEIKIILEQHEQVFDEKIKKNLIAALQKCITKAKNRKGKVKATFIKILLTGSGAAGKTSFSNLLMKSKFINFHHSTNIVQAKHAVSVKKAVVVGSGQYDNQNVVWLEMNDDSAISHLRTILLSLYSRKTQSSDRSNIASKHYEGVKSNESSQALTNLSGSKSNNVEESYVKPYVIIQKPSVAHRVSGLFQKSVKSEKMTSFDSLVPSKFESFNLDFYHGEVLNNIILLDTGGQPEYIHLLPTINIHPMINFVVHDLSKSLEEQVLVEYSEHGKHTFEPYHMDYSNLDMIKFLMSTINDSLEKPSSAVPRLVTIPGSDSSSYLCCVGTHADKVNKRTIVNIDYQLTAMFKKLDSKALVWQNKQGGVLFPADNTTAGKGDEEDPIASCIRNKIHDLAVNKDIYELPITWMVFELEVRQVCSNSGKAYISFSECCSIAHQTKLISSTEEVRSALIYHQLLGVLLYYPNVRGLCDYVITDHQWLYDKISSIVRFTFKQSSNLIAKDKLMNHGILTKELIHELNWKEEIKEEYFIALLVEMKIIAPMQREDDSGEDFFIPYVLPTYTMQIKDDDILSHYGYLQGEPLLVQFVSNLLPRGFFCCLTVQMLQQFSKSCNQIFTQKDTHHNYSNLITFHLQNAYSLSLMDRLLYLEVQIRHKKCDYYHQFNIHHKVLHIIDDALEVVCEQLMFYHKRIQYGFYCQCGEYDEHIAVITRTPPFDFALCRYGSNVPTELTDGHTVWLEEFKPTKAITESVKPANHLEPSGQQSKEYQLFTEYYNTLMHTLPASDLSHYFVSDKIISLADYGVIIRSTSPQNAAELLLERISSLLKKGNNAVFNKMLLIMERYGASTAKIVSLEIRKILSPIKCEKATESSSQTHKGALCTEPAKEEHHLVEYEVLICCFSQIVCCISAKTLSPHCVAEKIITMEDNSEILEVPSHTKAAGFLLSKISSGLDAGITEAFYKFLDIVEQYGNSDSKNVMAVVRRKLKSNFKGEGDDLLKCTDLTDPGKDKQTILDDAVLKSADLKFTLADLETNT